MRKNPKVAAACGRIHPTGDEFDNVCWDLSDVFDDFVNVTDTIWSYGQAFVIPSVDGIQRRRWLKKSVNVSGAWVYASAAAQYSIR